MSKHRSSEILLLAFALPLAGCQLVAFVSQGLVSPKVKARFKLDDRPTFVLVDDPNNVLGNPILPNVIANHVGFEIQRHAITTVIPPDKLHALVATLGSEFYRAPIDRIGREVGAEQVIYVNVQSVQLEADPGLYRPTATVRVQVVDVVKGVRVYPPVAQAIEDPIAMPYGWDPVTVEMAYQLPGLATRNDGMVMSRDLAARIGRVVAEIFYDHEEG